MISAEFLQNIGRQLVNGFIRHVLHLQDGGAVTKTKHASYYSYTTKHDGIPFWYAFDGDRDLFKQRLDKFLSWPKMWHAREEDQKWFKLIPDMSSVLQMQLQVEDFEKKDDPTATACMHECMHACSMYVCIYA